MANLALAIVLETVWLVQAAFSFWQDFSSSRVMASITTLLPEQCIVLRDGQQRRIDGKDVVPGDILRISVGNKLPADVRFLEVSSEARFDRSILTGEPLPLLASVESTDANYLETACIGMAGTHCVAGSAWGLVIETGDRTVFGRIARLTSAPKPGMTTLQREMFCFVSVIVSLMLATIVLVVVVWAAWLRTSHPEWITVPTLIVTCVSVAVAFMPEGLPIAVTASLTITANIMRKNQILCKSLKTVETLGAVNVICSDKTGTLTRNQMSVTDCLVGKMTVGAEEARGQYGSSKCLDQLATLGALCNAAEFDASTADAPIVDRKINGDATDSAILRFAESLTAVSDVRGVWTSIFQVAFNSKNKYAINVARSDAGLGEGAMLMIKGAPDVLLPRCASYIANSGSSERLSEADRIALNAVKDRWSSQGKRVILLAKRSLDAILFDPTNQPREYEREVNSQASSELTVVGLVAIVDPPRAEIPEVVRTLRGAGIKVFMVTGDFGLTAGAIAAECGIVTLPPDEIHDATDLVSGRESLGAERLEGAGLKEGCPFDPARKRALMLSGADLETLDDGQWDKVCRHDEVVFARTNPEHKLRIVKELQARGLIVGMTGDGVNDAPSLKAADIGIAMGCGSDIAIEASDMVLLDSFAGIVEAVRYGRLVYDNLKKTICYLLPAGSFSEFWPVIASVVFGLPQVLSSFLMIIVCCFTDCAAATALAYERPEADVLLRPPRNTKTDRLVDWRLILQAYGFVGVLESVSSFAMAYWYLSRRGLAFSQLWMWFDDARRLDVAQDELDAVLATASSIFFVNLVVM